LILCASFDSVESSFQAKLKLSITVLTVYGYG